MNDELQKKITEAQHRIEELYYETDGKCFLSFSGGKDSTVILSLIKQCEELGTIKKNGIPAVFADTGIELQVTYNFVKWVKESGWYQNVEIIRPEKSFSWVINNIGKPMLSKIKSQYLHQWCTGSRTDKLLLLLLNKGEANGKNYSKTRLGDKDFHMLHDDFGIIPSNKCCDYMKKKPMKAHAKHTGATGEIVGIRIAEGGARDLATHRRIKNGGKLCTKVDGKITVKYPIIDWTDDDVDDYIKEFNVPLSDAYTKYGFERTGCMACPYARGIADDLEYLYKNEPNRYKASMFWLKDVYIAQDVRLPFDEQYEREREREWTLRYHPMRKEMLEMHRPNSRMLKTYERGGFNEQMSIFKRW